MKMRLKSLQYSQYDTQPRAWRLEDCTFGDINLVVGQNATGKTRTLQAISELANLLSGDGKLNAQEGCFDAEFDQNGCQKYVLKWANKNVVEEVFIQDGRTLLQRGVDGTGKIFAAKLQLELDFHSPSDKLAVVSRRDAIQHPFLESLYSWGKAARYFRFGTAMGQEHLAIFEGGQPQGELNLKDSNQAVIIFQKGKAKYGSHYVQLILDDMKKIGYELEDILIQRMEWIGTNGANGANGKVSKPFGRLSGISIKEKELAAITYHHEISSGMFRALSLIIQLNYSLLASLPSCIIIDDIGEGLDYIRSTALIELLIKKVEDTTGNVQLIMSTNDRFVMNSVPLKYWSIIRRFPHKAKFYTYRNSKQLFDEFEFTGLSNFDFFSSNYLES